MLLIIVEPPYATMLAALNVAHVLTSTFSSLIFHVFVSNITTYTFQSVAVAVQQIKYVFPYTRKFVFAHVVRSILTNVQ